MEEIADLGGQIDYTEDPLLDSQDSLLDDTSDEVEEDSEFDEQNKTMAEM